jgi:hypothetical protein
MSERAILSPGDVFKFVSIGREWIGVVADKAVLPDRRSWWCLCTSATPSNMLLSWLSSTVPSCIERVPDGFWIMSLVAYDGDSCKNDEESASLFRNVVNAFLDQHRDIHDR